MPGFGSLVAGYVSGYFQAALSLGGMALTLIFGARFVYWYISNFEHFNNPQHDPIDILTALWAVVRLPLLGIALFAFGWLWALSTSLYIIRTANEDPSTKTPPKLT